MNWLCDTNIIGEIFKQNPNKAVYDWLSQQEYTFISVITVEEIYCGLSHKEATRKQEWFDKFLNLRCGILPINTEISKRCGVLRGQFLRNGITRTQADLLIASTAIINNLPLATRNTRDFENCGIQLFNPFP